MTRGSSLNLGCRNGAAALIFVLSIGGVARAEGGDPVADRHGHHLTVGSRPAGVPADFVLTHHGWFHPSCVVTVGEDEAVGADLVIRGKDGTARATLTPCTRERYDRRGGRVAAATDVPGGAAPEFAAPPQPATSVYDGYIVYYQSTGAIMPNSTLTTDWIVPPAPTNVATQDIAFFNDILTSAGGGDILQPVLDFNGETRGVWSVESEHCCISGNDMQTTPVVVAPGDLIRGIVAGTNCDTTGVCQNWTVTTSDVTSGKSTTLNTTAPSGVPNGVSPGSLETYDVSSCDMFPAGGTTTFTNNMLVGPNSASQTPKYTLINFQGVNAEVPKTCGYAGMASGNNFTLVYGAVIGGKDGGVVDSGTAPDARTGAGGSGGVSDGGSPDRGVVDAGRDVAADHTNGSGGSGAVDAGGPTGTGGVSGGSGGSPGTGGRSMVDAAGPPSDGSGARIDTGANGGCSCSAAPGSDVPAGAVLAVASLFALAIRRRTRRGGRTARVD